MVVPTAREKEEVMIITISQKPVQGKVERVCRICGDTYTGWNFVRCSKPSCQARKIEVAETWRLDYNQPASALAGHR
jgi:hypothetical protein